MSDDALRPDPRAVRLVPRADDAPPPRTWPDDVRRVFLETPPTRRWRPWSVSGGPGTGKSALVVDVAVRRILDGADPESVLVLTQSRRAAARVREQIVAGVTARGGAGVRASREPLVRTVHSYAFAVLRLDAARHANPPPRLITGAEQDAVLRELLRGDLDDGALQWPERLRPALGLAGFARELRDLVLRAEERGLGPEDIVALGRARGRDEWVAAGRFAQRYEEITLLRAAVGMEAPEATAPALDAAGLVGATLSAFAVDPSLLAAERARVRHLLVDDAHHLDPQAARLVAAVGRGTASSLVVGDPDQCVFGFRGADPAFLTELGERDPDRRIVLTTSRRAASTIVDATARVSSRLPGRGPQRGPAAEPDAEAGSVRVAVHASAAKEAAAIADLFRRAHVLESIPYADMAVVVRSVPRTLAPLRRALLAAGVPVTTSATEMPLARQYGVSALMLALRAVGGRRFDGEDALALVSGPIGGADPVALRRLRRGLRRVETAAGGDRDSATLVRRVLVGDGADASTAVPDGAVPDDAVRHDAVPDDAVRDAAVPDPALADTARPLVEPTRGASDHALVAGLTDVESAPRRRGRAVGTRARTAAREGGPEDVLWAAWQATGLERRWTAASARGGPVGAQADRDLDGVVALFDAAADYVDRLPRATVDEFVDYLDDQEIPGTVRGREVVTPDAVTVISAHAAAGREWSVVAVAGVQEGLWPTVRPRGTLLGIEDLLDAVAGVDTVAGDDDSPAARLSRTAPLLADERRLFLVACSRARRHLSVSAVESVGGDGDLVRSRFLDELRAFADEPDPEPLDVTRVPARVLALPTLVAELRSVVCDDAQPDDRRRRAAEGLARLAEAGVRGAHPDQWYGLGARSSDRPLWDDGDGPVPLSPSTVEQLTECPLRWMLERHGGRDSEAMHAVTGNLVHTLVQALAGHMTAEQVESALDRAWEQVDLGSSWFARHEHDRTRRMLDTFTAWMRTTRGELTEVGVEVPVDGVLEGRTGGEPDVRLRGRIDRLERDAEGRPVVVDVKTGRNPARKEDAENHAQLATYQVAVEAGAVEGEPAGPSGGGRLVYVAVPHRSDGATQRIQPPLDADAAARWRDTIGDAALATRGPGFLARIGDGCRHCPVMSSCPAHDEGRQVTQ